MRLSLGFSPCPNDTFIFDALVNHKIDTGDLSFEVFLEDVETLNKGALQKKIDITKLSYSLLPLVLEHYLVLNSGSALGNGVGPILISNKKVDSKNVNDHTIAIPGEYTTAHFLFSLAYPNVKNKIFLKYSQIEDFVLEGKGLGVIIHENRFTYALKGLQKITDLGDYWIKKTGKPIPLGGIVAKRSINSNIVLQVDALIRKSIEYAYTYHYKKMTDYVIANAQEMSEDIMRKHIDLYVNNYSINLGKEGKEAIQKILSILKPVNIESKMQDHDIFIK